MIWFQWIFMLVKCRFESLYIWFVYDKFVVTSLLAMTCSQYGGLNGLIKHGENWCLQSLNLDNVNKNKEFCVFMFSELA